MAVEVVAASVVRSAVLSAIGRLDDIPQGLIAEVAIDLVAAIRRGESSWPHPTGFSQQNFFAELDGSIWNNADYAIYVERQGNYIRDFVQANARRFIPEAAALVLEEPLESFGGLERRAFERAARAAQESVRSTRLARRPRQRRAGRLNELENVARQSFRRNLRGRRFDDEEYIEFLLDRAE